MHLKMGVEGGSCFKTLLIDELRRMGRRAIKTSRLTLVRSTYVIGDFVPCLADCDEREKNSIHFDVYFVHK